MPAMLETALINEGWPAAADWEALAGAAVAAAVAQTPYAGLATLDLPVEIAVRLTSDGEVQALNRDYRGKDKPTNVLSFPMLEADELDEIGDQPGEAMLGDIILAEGVCTREAAEKAIAMPVHATHLIVHGTLHLLGYDHMNDADAEAMEALETRAMAQLGHDDPYGD